MYVPGSTVTIIYSILPSLGGSYDWVTTLPSASSGHTSKSMPCPPKPNVWRPPVMKVK